MKSILCSIFFFIFCVGLSFQLYAQNVEFTKDAFPDKKEELKKANQNIEKGNEFYEMGEIFRSQAIEPYLAANFFNPNNAELNFKLGHCFLYSNFKQKALPFLEKAKILNPKIHPDINFYLGQAYHLEKQWDQAISNFKEFRKTINNDTDPSLIRKADKEIRECQNGKDLSARPVRVKVENLGLQVNSEFHDYKPFITADESVLFFTSRRPNTTGNEKDPVYNDYYEDIYYSIKQSDGKWSKALNIGEPVNTIDHDAISGLSIDGSKLIIYIGNKNNGDLFESALLGENWGKPRDLGKNINTDYHESSASYSLDGKSIYFVSNRPGGYGDLDIYVSHLDEKGKWGKAQNLGNIVNTEFGEEAVFMHPDGKTLYFSSQGHNSLGGYDIFKTTYDEKSMNWSKPENIGFPVNSTDDDVFYVVSASGIHGYYTSVNSSGMGGRDLYMITFIPEEKKEKPLEVKKEDNLITETKSDELKNEKDSVMNIVTEVEILKKDTIVIVKEVIREPEPEPLPRLTILKGIISDEITKKPLDASIEIIDNDQNKLMYTFNSNSFSGKYLTSLPAGKNYGIAVKKEGYLFHSENFNISDSAAFQEIIKDIALKKIQVGSTIVLKNIFYDFDKATVRQESTSELERLLKLLNETANLKIEISSHTDSKGANDYNFKLSYNRAKSVVDYLISKGISSDRLVSKGYGEEKPIATNDTEEGRQMNRRTEFKILGL
jgi:outer membrane protein OmpA-like peptidoglycan-associated protein/tetratricopeptide (TPR) repeat protein